MEYCFWPIRADQMLRLVTAKLSSRVSPQPEPLARGNSLLMAENGSRPHWLAAQCRLDV